MLFFWQRRKVFERILLFFPNFHFFLSIFFSLRIFGHDSAPDSIDHVKCSSEYDDDTDMADVVRSEAPVGGSEKMKDGANGELGRNDASTRSKVVGSRKKYRSRSTSASSQDSISSGSYSGECGS